MALPRKMHYVGGMQIDHDPKEPPRFNGGNGIFYIWAALLPAMWGGFWYFDMLEWRSAILGALSGGVFVTIMIEITGNKVPPWMRR